MILSSLSVAAENGHFLLEAIEAFCPFMSMSNPGGDDLGSGTTLPTIMYLHHNLPSNKFKIHINIYILGFSIEPSIFDRHGRAVEHAYQIHHVDRELYTMLP